jgi:small subunit ribosomal protein S8
MITDPIADMLTRVRNASSANHEEVAVPSSRMKRGIAELLVEEGYILGAVVEGEAPHETLKLRLKPRERSMVRALQGLRRISRPGLRVYARKSEIPRVLGGLGIAIISTSRGLMTGQRAQREGLGGEVVAYVW